jgi:glycosyltransferase involved in cell wall biosynthesis
MRSLIKRLYPKATQISAISYGVKESLLSFGICDSKIKVIYNPQPIKKIRKLATEAPAVELCPDRKSIITVGRLVDEKDHVTLIRAFEKVRKRIKSRLYIIGDGPNREKLESLAESLDVADDVIFLGWQSNPFAILKQAELFILSSHFEGFGNVIVEAMVCGLPIVSTDCPSGPSEILKDGKAGLLVPVKDSDSLANAITKLLTDQQAYEEYSRKSLNRVNDFDVSLIAKEYLDFMKVSTESNCSSQKFERPLQNSKHQILTSQIKFKKN